jgi:hypothetical protein
LTEQRDSIPGNKYDWRDDWLLALAALIAVVLLLGCSASLLNRQFYKTYSPFFDSAAYHYYLATVVGVFEERGTLEGLNYALGSPTAPLPGLEALALARLGLVHSPVPRLLGIQLQLIWILVLAGLLFFYWFGFRRVSAWVAVALSLPFIMFTGLFHFNGGLMDFRLDLSLYIFFSITVVCYLMTEHIDSYGIWIGMGFAAAFACLTRATAPVYLVVALGPPWVARMWFASDRAKLLKQTFAMLVPLCLFGLSYFAYNFNHLYYYYVVWSADANANLPWSKSIAHFRFAWRAMGTPPRNGLYSVSRLAAGRKFREPPHPPDRLEGSLDRHRPGALSRLAWGRLESLRRHAFHFWDDAVRARPDEKPGDPSPHPLDRHRTRGSYARLRLEPGGSAAPSPAGVARADVGSPWRYRHHAGRRGFERPQRDKIHLDSSLGLPCRFHP